MESKAGNPANLHNQTAQLEAENKLLQEEIKILRSNYEAALVNLDKQLAIEKRYEESQARFSAIFERSKLGNKIIGPDLKIIQVNPALQAMLGYSEQELVGTKITDHAHPDSVNQWYGLQESLWTEQIPSFQMDVCLFKKDGTILWCSVTSIVFEDNGSTLGYTVVEDISGRKSLEEKLLNSESMLRESQEAAGIGSFVVDTQTGMVHTTPILNSIFGLPEDEQLIHLNVFFDRIEPEDLELQKQLMTKAIEQGSSYTAQYRIRVGDTEKWMWEKGQIRKNALDNKTRVIGVIQDITKQKEKEEKFRRSEAFLLDSQEIARLGSFQWNPETTQASWTPQLFKLYDLEPYAITINLDYIKSIIHPEDKERFLAQVYPVINNELESYSVEYRAFTAKGRMKHMWARGRKVDGRLTGTVMDITERKELELKNAKLASRNDELDHFVYTASHDLRSPVNNIEMLVEFLSQDYNGRKDYIERYIDLLHKSVVQLKHTLQDLTTVTEIHQQEQKDLVNLHELIEEVKVALHKEITEASAIVNTHLDMPFLEIPRKHARSLIYNMLSNSLKFRAESRKPVITISSSLKEGKTRLSFEDNGTGIREADQSKVFMIFKRFHQQIAGRGIGMYLVKRIVDLNNGKVELESKENVGTIFRFQFPGA